MTSMLLMLIILFLAAEKADPRLPGGVDSGRHHEADKQGSAWRCAKVGGG
jgi:hypothetical protein